MWDACAILNWVIVMKEISERILKAMQDAEMSYGELSKQTGIPKSALQRYATGTTEKLPLPRLEAIADALHISAAYLMGWSEETPPASAEAVSDPTEQEVLEAFRQLSPEQQQLVLSLLETMK